MLLLKNLQSNYFNLFGIKFSRWLKPQSASNTALHIYKKKRKNNNKKKRHQQRPD